MRAHEMLAGLAEPHMKQAFLIPIGKKKKTMKNIRIRQSPEHASSCAGATSHRTNQRTAMDRGETKAMKHQWRPPRTAARWDVLAETGPKHKRREEEEEEEESFSLTFIQFRRLLRPR